MSLIIWVDNKDNRESVRLYEIEFRWVELSKLILAWKGDFRTLRVEGVLPNKGLGHKF